MQNFFRIGFSLVCTRTSTYARSALAKLSIKDKYTTPFKAISPCVCMQEPELANALPLI